jgi:hypothetical protein
MKSRALWMIVTLVICGCRAAPAVDPVPQELDRLSALLARIEAGGVPDMLKDTMAPNRAAIERVRKTTSPQLRLYRLRDAYVGVATAAFVAAQKDAAVDGGKFLALWSAQPVRAIATPAGMPLLHASLVQSSSNRAEKLYRASLPYGKADGPFSGTYYLGEAHANAAFAQFVASLDARELDTQKDEQPPAANALRSALEAMDTEMLAAFGKDPAAPGMISVSVRLKEARELLDRGSLAGATLLMLEARLMYGRATAPVVKGAFAPPADLPKDSMAELWRASDNPIAARDVLPYYVSLRKQTAAVPVVAAKRVKVTLIRWPYT